MGSKLGTNEQELYLIKREEYSKNSEIKNLNSAIYVVHNGLDLNCS